MYTTSSGEAGSSMERKVLLVGPFLSFGPVGNSEGGEKGFSAALQLKGGRQVDGAGIPALGNVQLLLKETCSRSFKRG